MERAGEGAEVGVGVVVGGESSARGIELVMRLVGRGRWFVSRGGGGCVVLSEGGDAWGGAGWEVWSHAARAEGSIGQVEGGGSFGADGTLLEDVLPMLRSSSWTQRGGADF